MPKAREAGRPRAGKVCSAEQAVAQLRSGQTLAVGGAGGVQEPDALLAALLQRYRSSGEPRGLTEMHPIRTGEIEGRGTSIFGEPGMLSCMIGGSMWPVGVPQIIQRIHDCDIEAYNLPIGILYAMLEATAAGRPGVVSAVGLGTCVDPREGGGALNAVSRRRLVEPIVIDGRDYLFYRAIPVDCAFIRGTVADTAGNLTMDEEPAVCGPLVLAQAARASGGRVIAQVKQVVPFGELDPRRVRVPGIFVDSVVEHPEQWQTTRVRYDPTAVGMARRGLADLPELKPLQEQVLRRALALARDGDALAIGFGLPGYLPAVAVRQGRYASLTFTIEHGVTGGLNGYAAGGSTFPMAHDPEAIIDAADQLRGYAGGCVDCAFLGVGEVDAQGNVNVSKFGDRIPGSGGFIEITQGIRRIVFCTTLGDDGRRKFVPAVQQRTFSAERALAAGQDVRYVTENATFQLTGQGLTLVEVAAGTDVREDILARIGCQVAIAADLAERAAAQGD